MGIKMTTPASRIDTLINKEKERVEMLTVRALSYLGELCVIEARNRPQEISWYDRSGNLRSSIGYAIIHNGKILEYSDFTQVRQGNEGVRKGKALIEELSKKFANAVSYTHLDVYKRQVKLLIKNFVLIFQSFYL